MTWLSRIWIWKSQLIRSEVSGWVACYARSYGHLRGNSPRPACRHRCPELATCTNRKHKLPTERCSCWCWIVCYWGRILRSLVHRTWLSRRGDEYRQGQEGCWRLCAGNRDIELGFGRGHEVRGTARSRGRVGVKARGTIIASSGTGAGVAVRHTQRGPASSR